MLTLATNQMWDTAKMSKLIGTFFGRVERNYLGHTFNELPPDKRADGVFFIEKPNVNVHAHGLVTIPYDYVGLPAQAQAIWLKLCPSGSVHVQTAHSALGAAQYCTKEMASAKYDPDQVVLLRGQMSLKSLSACSKSQYLFHSIHRSSGSLDRSAAGDVSGGGVVLDSSPGALRNRAAKPSARSFSSTFTKVDL